jgi:hypothetical protein
MALFPLSLSVFLPAPSVLAAGRAANCPRRASARPRSALVSARAGSRAAAHCSGGASSTPLLGKNTNRTSLFFRLPPATALLCAKQPQVAHPRQGQPVANCSRLLSAGSSAQLRSVASLSACAARASNQHGQSPALPRPPRALLRTRFPCATGAVGCLSGSLAALLCSGLLCACCTA